MRTPERSSAIARALAAEGDGLPKDFAAQVARLAEAEAERRSSRWSEVGLVIGFLAMIGTCVFGWSLFGAQALGGAEWLEPLARAASAQPLLVVGVAGLVIVQLLTFRRRAAT
jgi:hypothetical protein